MIAKCPCLKLGTTLVLAVAPLCAQTPAAQKTVSPGGSAVERMAENLRKGGFKSVAELNAPQASIPRRSSFYERVLILSGDAASHCVIPQGSVLHLPDELRARILEKPEGKLVSWETMLRQGKSWLGTQEVSVEAARGKPAEIDAIAAQLAQERRIMIAVNKGRPIAILQPAAAQEPSAEKPQNPTR